ncbi:hypothetical protein ACFQT0_07175 [Hymenobacter humi]|uniref:Uncharacterized protein n=1 Tax=Hymenobacter humi TaxID=1411620 RepID=A0ABW2U2G7_9BACT
MLRSFSLLPAALFVGTALLLTGCDSTPRERQEVAREGVRELDTLARKAGQKVANVGKATARYSATTRARRNQPLDPRQEIAMENKLMGPYSGQARQPDAPRPAQRLRPIHTRRARAAHHLDRARLGLRPRRVQAPERPGKADSHGPAGP